MGKAEQRCGQASSVAILRHGKFARRKIIIAARRYHNSSFLTPHSSFLPPPLLKKFVGLSIILDTIIKKFDRRKPFEGTHRTVVCST